MDGRLSNRCYVHLSRNAPPPDIKQPQCQLEARRKRYFPETPAAHLVILVRLGGLASIRFSVASAGAAVSASE
jgi:hypothetical protein